jgi:hypothetical protein
VFGDEKRGRDLTVGVALGDEYRDPPFCFRQRTTRGCAAADALTLGARLLSPERRTEPFEEGERLIERRARGSAVLGAPLRNAEREQRARVLERILRSRMFDERALEALRGTGEVALRGEQKPSAPCSDRKCP